MDAINNIAAKLKDQLVICNIGFPSRELFHVKDSSTHFYMLGSMGMASSIGLGLALAQKRKVIVFDGDGSLLMNLGSLVTIYNQAPKNLVLIVLDNECYGSTGNQCTYSITTDLKKVAEAIGFRETFFFFNINDFESVLDADGPVFVHLKVKPGNADVPVIPLEPKEIKERFMKEVQKINKH
jgi:sulfopyruvate decarboxylase subunit beta